MPIMKRIADAQIGTNVQLNDGSVWEVLIIHPNKFSRPILKNEKMNLWIFCREPIWKSLKTYKYNK